MTLARSPIPVFLLCAAVFTIPAEDARVSAQTSDTGQRQFRWIQDFLREFSTTQDIDDGTGGREVLSTRLETHPDSGRAILSYERSTYASASPGSLRRRQVIQYTVTFDDLDAATLRRQAWTGQRSGDESWIVIVDIRPDADFVPYTNLVETRMSDGSVDVTSSRGRVRTIALGYFTSQDQADQLVEGVGKFLRESGGTETV